MRRFTDPDQDKTNPEPRYIHQQFDDEGEEYAAEFYEVIDDETADRADEQLYDPRLGVNTLENDVEESRERPFFDTLYRDQLMDNALYPDEYERLHGEKEADLSEQEFDIEGYYGTSFDPAGDEGEPMETRPADIEDRDEGHRPTEQGKA